MHYFLDEFLQTKFVECSNANTFGAYELLEQAEIGCSSNITCIGILDEGCDNVGPYRLCKKGFMISTLSCISKKKIYTGMGSYLFFHPFSLNINV